MGLRRALPAGRLDLDHRPTPVGHPGTSNDVAASNDVATAKFYRMLWKVKSTVSSEKLDRGEIEVSCSIGDQAGALREFNSSSNEGGAFFPSSSVGGS
jgi:hypothetical protein